jgi:hypothetical protein
LAEKSFAPKVALAPEVVQKHYIGAKFGVSMIQNTR